jgi:hypothetical protein
MKASYKDYKDDIFTGGEHWLTALYRRVDEDHLLDADFDAEDFDPRIAPVDEEETRTWLH